MTAVAERIEPPELFDFFVAQRAAMGLTVVPLGEVVAAALMQATLRRRRLVGLLSDRDLVGNGIEVEFFGETTTMPAGPATLALRTGATLVTAAVYSGPGPRPPRRRATADRHDAARVPPDRRGPAHPGDRHRFEGLIRRAPEQWHVFQPLWLADRPKGDQ